MKYLDWLILICTLKDIGFEGPQGKAVAAIIQWAENHFGQIRKVMQIASEKIILLLMEKWMKIYERIELQAVMPEGEKHWGGQ